MGHLRTNRTSGFTMVELVITITVITVMLSVLAGVSFRFVGTAKEVATATTIMKVNGIIQDRIRAFREFDFTDAAIIGRDTWNLSHTSPDDRIMTTALAEILIRKTAYKKAFPQAFAELDAAQSGLFFPGATIPPTGQFDAKYECGIVLYAMVMKGNTFGVPTPADDTFNSAEVRIGPETGGLPCLIDAYGEPLRFYRWPTRLIRCGEQGFGDYNGNGSVDVAGCLDTNSDALFCPAIRPNSVIKGPTPASLLIANLPPYDVPALPASAIPSNHYVLGLDNAPGISGGTGAQTTLGWPESDDPEPLNVDPDDPTFKLSAWLFDGNLSTADQRTRRLQFITNVVTGPAVTNIVGPQQNGFHDFFTYHTPLIVSGGPDKKLGLFEPSGLSDFGYLAAPKSTTGDVDELLDNITNLNQRAGGK